MKSTILLFLPLITLALANPVAPSENNGRLVARDRTCTLARGVSSQGCDSNMWDGKRVKTINPGEKFDIRCGASGREIKDGIDTGIPATLWLQIPGWGCWVHSTWVPWDCYSKSYYLSQSIYMLTLWLRGHWIVLIRLSLAFIVDCFLSRILNTFFVYNLNLKYSCMYPESND